MEDQKICSLTQLLTEFLSETIMISCLINMPKIYRTWLLLYDFGYNLRQKSNLFDRTQNICH